MPNRSHCTRVSYKRCRHGDPIRWLGMAPHAGVLLIAATLILATYGARTHALVVDLPLPYPAGYIDPLSPAYDRITIDPGGQVRFNGTPVQDRDLHDMLMARPSGPAQVSLLFEPDGMVPYPRTLEILGLLQATGSLKDCFLFGNISQFGQYDRPETFAELAPAQPRRCFVPPPVPDMPTYR
ncbi:hypothetical protein P8Q88_08360 [Qipengyuania sp. XHP0207]|uniref:ExbD/TolR family protein n=1 Tax=Qipengyuania sp. XHP0207 TaxID=3038078 RepID=UPI00241E53B6|nr:hypothetical protein [Qipengyuania sp. XHP0207]MDG5748192.1 hypothetical protein [Qipengyuania sp. XHP0207]